jgi:hypothetical protein
MHCRSLELADDCLALISVSLLFSMFIFFGRTIFPLRELAPRVLRSKMS